jgi:hypothetical protein
MGLEVTVVAAKDDVSVESVRTALVPRIFKPTQKGHRCFPHLSR